MKDLQDSLYLKGNCLVKEESNYLLKENFHQYYCRFEGNRECKNSCQLVSLLDSQFRTLEGVEGVEDSLKEFEEEVN